MQAAGFLAYRLFSFPKRFRFSGPCEKTCRKTVMTLQLRGQLRILTGFP